MSSASLGSFGDPKAQSQIQVRESILAVPRVCLKCKTLGQLEPCPVLKSLLWDTSTMAPQLRSFDGAQYREAKEPTIYAMCPERGHSHPAPLPQFLATGEAKNSQSARKASSSKGFGVLWVSSHSPRACSFWSTNGGEIRTIPATSSSAPSLYKSVNPGELEDDTCMSTTSDLQRPLTSSPASFALPQALPIHTHMCISLNHLPNS